MVIDIEKLKIEWGNLSAIIDNLENTYNNMYNEFNYSSSFWRGDLADTFFKEIEMEKVKVRNMIPELTSHSDLYKYIINAYEKIGNKIYYELQMKDEILNNINEYINLLSNIIKKYNNLNLKNCNEVRNIIISEKSTLSDTLTNAYSYRKKLRNFYLTIEQINDYIDIKLSKNKIETIVENDIKQYM